MFNLVVKDPITTRTRRTLSEHDDTALGRIRLSSKPFKHTAPFTALSTCEQSSLTRSTGFGSSIATRRYRGPREASFLRFVGVTRTRDIPLRRAWHRCRLLKKPLFGDVLKGHGFSRVDYPALLISRPDFSPRGPQARKGTGAIQFVKDLVLEVPRLPLTYRSALSPTSSPVARAAFLRPYNIRRPYSLRDSLYSRSSRRQQCLSLT